MCHSTHAGDRGTFRVSLLSFHCVSPEELASGPWVWWQAPISGPDVYILRAKYIGLISSYTEACH